MAKEDRYHFGKEVSRKESRAKSGGITMAKQRDVMNYKPPQIPGWDPKGSMGPGIGGVNYGNCGTQGPKAFLQSEKGGAGLGGDRPSSGTNRKG